MIPKADRQSDWRSAPGNPLMYDALGAAQFGVLTMFFGLRETHKLLEIGAGSLRAGRFLIPYLDEGHYCGVEPKRTSIDLGLEHALGREMERRKKPRFSTRGDFCFDDFSETFDYALSFSVLTHVPPGDIPVIFANVAKCTHEQSLFLVTAALNDEELIVDREKWSDRLQQYSAARIEDAVHRAGLQVLWLGKLFQDWMVVFREGNERAMRGAEQMVKVTRAGRQAHKDWIPPPGFQKEFRLPSGRQADAVNFQTKEVLELKPNNPKAIRAGERQVQQYVDELNRELGGGWTGRVVTYGGGSP